jgi:sporulation protein YlmC with PRC-barrel domain
MADPVSWLVVERGWRVVDPDGNELGQVENVVGDAENDIFNGLAVRKNAFGRERYVPSERVAEIHEGVVTLDMDELGDADDDEPPANVELA